MADIPAGDCAAALAISMPRARTNINASRLLIAPHSAAAASSPTECPEVTAKFLIPRACAASSDVATMRGWALAVSFISSASAVVPSRTRSKSISLDHWAKSFSNAGSATQSVSIPGVCEP